MTQGGFQQARFAVENQESFGELRRYIDEAFSASGVESFLKKIGKADVPVRGFERILEKRILEPAKARLSAWALYQSLSPSDQGLVREYYLTKVEEVEGGLRTKYQKVYRYW
jgi:hypothetical protein